MIEGNLADISLPGLLQFLAGETTKSYRIRVGKAGHQGDLFICEGELLVATFGLLEGLDALSEFLTWNQGEFTVERLPSRFKNTIKSNVRLRLDQPGSFADQCSFLSESSVGVNTEIVPSRNFGTAEWQEALHVQPLEKEDYVVLGWITDGRTMRQAMREFQFDLKRAIGILYRLLITRSVEIVRPTYLPEGPDEKNIDKLAEERLQRVVLEKKSRRGTVEFQAVDITGGEGRKMGATTDDTSPSPGAAVVEPQKAAPVAPSANSKPPEPNAKLADTKNSDNSQPTENGYETGPQKPIKKEDLLQPDSQDGKNRKQTLTPAEAVAEAPADGKNQPVEPAAANGSESNEKSKIIDKMKGAVKEDSDAEPVKSDGNSGSATSEPFKALTQALAHTEAEKALKKSKRMTAESPRATGDMPAVEPDLMTTLGSTRLIDEDADALKARKAAEEKEEIEIEQKKVMNVMASRALVPTNFDERKTDPLPLVSIDIERLLNSTFILTDTGTMALSNPSLDKLVQSVLLDVERGKSLLLVLTDTNRSDSAMLATYKYCLDRGYIEHSDIVMGLTVDLLLGRLELVQYLLQRRRITGDQLRDLSAISTKQGINIEKLLVAAGYVLPNDMERLLAEKKRFAGT